MTYKELKDRLSKCELTLSKLKDSNTIGSTKDIKNKVQQLTLLKESLQIQLAEADKGVVYTDDEDTAKDLADDGANVKLTKEGEGVRFSVDETKAIATSVGKSVALAVKNLGDEIAHMKATNIEENSFDINIEYRNDNEDSFSFYIKEDSLHLQDFSFDKELTDVGVKPSGEAQVNVEHLANELTKHFKSMNEKVDSKDKPELKKLSKALSNSVKAHLDQKKSLDKAINTEGEVSEAPEGVHYIKVENSELFEALGILEKAFDDSKVNFELNDPNIIYIHNADNGDMHDAVEELQQNGIIIDETSIDSELDLDDYNTEVEEETDDYGRPHVDPKGSRTFLEPDEMLPHNRFKKMTQKEDTDVGHVDDEPDMLQATAYEIATYAAKLSKKLAKYDAHDGEVDFPNWWQAKLILAKDYMSKAYHYLDSEEKQPALDQLALENLTYKEPKGIDKVAGGIPYRREGNKFIISMSLPDDVKERLLAKAKKNGFKAAPNQAGGVTIMAKDNVNERLSGDAREAIYDLQNILDQAAQLGDEARQIVKQHFPNELSAGEAYDVFSFGTSSNSYDKTLETLISDIERTAEEEDEDMDEGRNVDDLYDITVHTMKRLAAKYKAGDKSVVPHLKKLTDVKKKLEQEKIKKASNIGKGQELDEAGPGFKHDCAAKVVHEKHGKGNTIPEKHTLVKEGNKYVVTHYDVLFENGNTVLDIPVNELKIETTNEHWHKGYKKKKK
jgi:hypothetical protein